MGDAIKVEEEYRNWLTNVYRKTNGEKLKPSSIDGTANALKLRVAKLEGIEINPTNLFEHDNYDEMIQLDIIIRNADNYPEENHKCGRGYLSQGLIRYIEFLAYRDNVTEKEKKKSEKKAQKRFYSSSIEKINERDDDEFERRVNSNLKVRKPSGYSRKPREIEKDSDKTSKNVIHYIRHKERAENALAIAGYKCEIDPSHITFKRRKNKEIDYTEPHHLIPMSKQGKFKYSLDTEENIVSLCSNCHNCIHYGEDADKLIKYLYDKRKELLKEAGIEITYDELLEMYNISPTLE